MDTITLPKRTREGSLTPQDIDDAEATLAALPEGSREAIVVGRGFESENAARNRARLMGNALTERTGLLYHAHAVPDPDDSNKWVGAVSVRANQTPRTTTTTDRPEGAPTLRALQDAARDLKIKGRSKMDYDDLWNAIDKSGNDPMSYGTG
jgi:hypothetical protein